MNYGGQSFWGWCLFVGRADFPCQDEDATLQNLSETLEARIGISAGTRLVLMSGESTLDKRGLFVRHLPKAPISYVVQRVGAGHAALSLTRMLLHRQETPSTLSDINNIRAISAVTFNDYFNESLVGVTLPANLQSLTFGAEYNQSLEGVTLPANLQNLTFGDRFNQSLEGVTLPANLHSLTFGDRFNQSLEGVTWPANLQNLTFGDRFNQSMEGVT